MRLLLLPVLLAAPLAAAPLHFTSGEGRTHLLELYTSEGCSSCPPAEEWLGSLRDAPGLWRDFVPVAFHVVYWDHLGWRDRFASKEFTARQYAYSAAWGSDTVYTPGFVLDGAEWRRSTPPSASAGKTGLLAVEYADDGACRVTFAAAGDYEVHVALLGGGIVSGVKAGENEGRTLHHEFVALALTVAPLRDGAAELKLPRKAEPGVTRQALAVWITRRGDPTSLQATGGWVD
ncbi:DUF1223 domain-containing protein [Opitutus sp. GAS368]|uniref:DUF1223 domain-containing protein n=1 Tax=Opitutus sp. GAS368 TaxID=1882749 RepID=UPI0012FDD162|nr:DUF1223 domain-containing protein [Opitutus sp. GAS368]